MSDPFLLETFLAFAFQREQEQRTSAEAQLSQRTEDFAAILDVLLSIVTSPFKLGDVLALLAVRAQAITKAEGAAIALESEGEIHCVTRAGELAPPLAAGLSRDAGLSGECIRTARTVSCGDAECDPRVDAAAFRDCGLRSVIAAPIRGEQGIVGLVEIFSTRANAFAARECDILELIAAVAAQAVRLNAALEAHPSADALPPDADQSSATESTEDAEAVPADIIQDHTLQAPLEPPAAATQEPVADLVVTSHRQPEKRSPRSRWLLVLLINLVLAALVWQAYRLLHRVEGRAVPTPAESAGLPMPRPPAPPPASAITPTDAPAVAGAPAAASLNTAPATATLRSLRYSSKPDFTALALELDRPITVRAVSLHDPERIYFDLVDTRIAEELAHTPSKLQFDISDKLVSRVRLAQNEATVARIVLDLKARCDYSFVMSQSPPYRLVIDVMAPGPKNKNKNEAPAIPSPAALPRSQPRTFLGTSAPLRIVIDAGHGGQDLGAIGRTGLLEKNLTLDVAQRLGALLEARLGARIVFTRTADTFVSLQTRSLIANGADADLIISIHGNSSRSPLARGVETYYFDDGVAKLRHSTDARTAQSRELAAAVQRALTSGAPSRLNRGIKRADFVVLADTTVPAVLTEIAFLSSVKDERKLQSGPGRQKIADAIYRGIASYLRARPRPTPVPKTDTGTRREQGVKNGQPPLLFQSAPPSPLLPSSPRA